MKDKIENKRETVCSNYSTVIIFSIKCMHMHIFYFFRQVLTMYLRLASNFIFSCLGFQ